MKQRLSGDFITHPLHSPLQKSPKPLMKMMLYPITRSPSKRDVAGSSPAGVASLFLEFLRVFGVPARTNQNPCKRTKSTKTGTSLHSHYTDLDRIVNREEIVDEPRHAGPGPAKP